LNKTAKETKPAISPSGKKVILLAGALFLLLAVATSLILRRSGPDAAPSAGGLPKGAESSMSLTPSWEESFSEGTLDVKRWTPTSEGDFEGKSIDVFDVRRLSKPDFRLRLRASTRGTRDDTVKFLGVRSAAKVRFGRETRIASDIDWNDQANGCYLSAGLVLAPAQTEGNPLQGKDWLNVEYVGVPPGKNGRLAAWLRTGGHDEWVFSEGWPQVNRGGRPLSLQRLEIIVRQGNFEIVENGRSVYESKGKKLPFAEAHVYLQVSSHSNYPPRELYFDNIRVTSLE
jgi:hypothetical protein